MAKKKKTAARAKTSAKRKTTASKKAAPKKAGAARKTAAPAAAIAPRNVNVKPADKPRTKSEIMSTLSEVTGLSKKEVGSVISALGNIIEKDIGKRGCGMFTVPGLLKIRVINKPATKARKGVNPFTGEEMVFKAKPSRNVVRIRPLKALKDMV